MCWRESLSSVSIHSLKSDFGKGGFQFCWPSTHWKLDFLIDESRPTINSTSSTYISSQSNSSVIGTPTQKLPIWNSLIYVIFLIIFSTNEASLWVEVNISHVVFWKTISWEQEKTPCKKEKGEVVLRKRGNFDKVPHQDFSIDKILLPALNHDQQQQSNHITRMITNSCCWIRES